MEPKFTGYEDFNNIWIDPETGKRYNVKETPYDFAERYNELLSKFRVTRLPIHATEKEYLVGSSETGNNLLKTSKEPGIGHLEFTVDGVLLWTRKELYELREDPDTMLLKQVISVAVEFVFEGTCHQADLNRDTTGLFLIAGRDFAVDRTIEALQQGQANEAPVRLVVKRKGRYKEFYVGWKLNPKAHSPFLGRLLK